jgi:hypothetical protein
MTQNTAICPGSIHICKARFSRLNADGTFKGGSNNHVVTDSIMSVDFTPEIKEGEAKEVVTGCDQIALAYKGYDKLLRFTLAFQMATLAPAVIELLTGAGVLVDTSTIPVPVGNVFPNQLSASSTPQPPVAAEFWTDAWINDRQVDPPSRYIRWVFPMTFWQIDASKLENDFFLPSFKGFTRQNPNWGNVYGDWPSGIAGSLIGGAYFWDNTQPGAVCGYSSVST